MKNFSRKNLPGKNNKDKNEKISEIQDLLKKINA